MYSTSNLLDTALFITATTATTTTINTITNTTTTAVL